MNNIKSSEITSSLSELGFKKIQNIRVIKDGINSCVFKFKSNGKNLVAKSYKHKKNLRIKREKLFYKYLKKVNNKNILNPILFNINKNLSVYPYIAGSKIKKINNDQIKVLSNFINQINNRKISKSLPLAIDGIKDRNYHLKLCENKINDLKAVKINSLVKKNFSNFLNKKIIPKFKEIKNNFNLNKNSFLPKMKLTKEEMIVSPSDFGLHNIIKKKNKLFFIDFEYAGLDDPVKLLCDFYCQPDQFISLKKKKLFLENLTFKDYSISKLNSYINFFLPFHKLKWCCIILNIFKDIKILRNKKAIKNRVKIMKIQLVKSKIYFKKNLGTN
jgi:predicted Ser/Thr protein kinase